MNLSDLKNGEVHLWYLKSELFEEDRLATAGFSLFNDEERDRYERYRHPRPKVLHITARALARTILGRYLGQPPRSLEFGCEEHGKPFLVGQTGKLRFNLAHTEGMAVLLAAWGREVGVDVEAIDRQRIEFHSIARSMFAAPEVALVEGAADAAMRFFEIWTLKEAYVKGIGTGLTVSLKSFWFSFDQQPPAFHTGPDVPRPLADWGFELLRLEDRFQVGCGVAEAGRPIDLKLADAATVVQAVLLGG